MKLDLEQVEYVFRCISCHIDDPGTFRYLIYDRLGFDSDAYEPLYKAGGMKISNFISEAKDDIERVDKLKLALKDAISTYRGRDCVVTEDRIEAWEAALKAI